MDVLNGHFTNLLTPCGYTELLSFPLRVVLINAMGFSAGYLCLTKQLVWLRLNLTYRSSLLLLKLLNF